MSHKWSQQPCKQNLSKHVSITAYQFDRHRYGSTWLNGFSWAVACGLTVPCMAAQVQQSLRYWQPKHMQYSCMMFCICQCLTVIVMIYHINYYLKNTANFTVSIIAVNQATLIVKDFALIQFFSDSSTIKLQVVSQPINLPINGPLDCLQNDLYCVGLSVKL